MRVLLDVSDVPDEPDGTGVYVVNLVRALDAGAEIRLELLARSGDRARWRALAPRSRVHDRVPANRILRQGWWQVGATRTARRLGVELWHGPQHRLPARLPTRSVVTVHDMTPFDHPEYYARSVWTREQDTIRSSVAAADVVVAVSRSTAERVRELLEPRGPVLVAPHGVDRSRFRPIDDERGLEADRHALEEVGVRSPFLAHVGAIEPRKNVTGLVDAFARLMPSHPDLQLVLAGRPGWHSDDVERVVRHHGAGERVRTLGFVDSAVVAALYRRAEAVVAPSHAEGFGLPALEALACGAPLVASAGTPMEELAAGAAVLVRPGQDEELASAIERVLDDPRLAERLRAAGPRVAGRYSWGLCARAHIDAYRHATERVAA